MSKKENKQNNNRKGGNENEQNLNNNYQKNYLQESPSDDNEKDRPIHFQVEYDKNKNFENQMESSQENSKNKSHSQSPYISNKNEQEFVIEKNNQINNQQNPNNNQEYYEENNNMNNNNNENNNYYDIIKENENEKEDNNFNNYYNYYLNNYNNYKNEEDEVEPKKIISFATKMYQGRIDPVKLNVKYQNFWEKHNKSKNKYKQKIDALQKVFHPYGYNTITRSFKRKGKSQSRYTTKSSFNTNYDRPPFDNTKQPLPKKSYLLVQYDYGINDPNYGKEEPENYNRKKMAKLRMLKQPLKYYYPFTTDTVKRKQSIKYE